jgi:hypothetical protein
LADRICLTLPEKDDADAINKDNIIDERTRGAAKETYREPGDTEGLPTDD